MKKGGVPGWEWRFLVKGSVRVSFPFGSFPYQVDDGKDPREKTTG